MGVWVWGLGVGGWGLGWVGGGMGRGVERGTSRPVVPSLMLWSKSKMVICIKGIVTSWPLSFLLKVNLSPTVACSPSVSAPARLISPKVGTPSSVLKKLVPALSYDVVVSTHRLTGTPTEPVTRKASEMPVTFPKTAHARREAHGQAGPSPSGLCVLRANAPIACEQSSVLVRPSHPGTCDGEVASSSSPPCPPRLLCSKVEPAPQTRPTSVLGNLVWER